MHTNHRKQTKKRWDKPNKAPWRKTLKDLEATRRRAQERAALGPYGRLVDEDTLLPQAKLADRWWFD